MASYKSEFQKTYVDLTYVSKRLNMSPYVITDSIRNKNHLGPIKLYRFKGQWFVKRHDVNNQLRNILRIQRTPNKLTVNQISQQFKLSYAETMQLVKKLRLVPKKVFGLADTYYNINAINRHLEVVTQIKNNRKHIVKLSSKNRKLFFDNPITKDNRISISKLAETSHLKRKYLSKLIEHRLVNYSKDETDGQWYLNLQTAEYLKLNYLNYPDFKIWNRKQICQQFNIELNTLRTILSIVKFDAIEVLGDEHKYYTKNQIAELKRIINSIYIPASKEHRLVQNTNHEIGPNDVSLKNLRMQTNADRRLLVKYAKQQLIPYQYNGHELFFSKADADNVKSRYKQYPTRLCINQSRLLEMLKLNNANVEFQTICYQLEIKPFHVLGVAGLLYSIHDVKQIVAYYREHVWSPKK